jgi:hypothetical protein
MTGSHQRTLRASPHARRIVALCSAIGSFTVLAMVGDLLSPMLLHRHPVALLLLTPRTAYVVAVARDVPAPTVLVVAVARLCAADPLHFMLGRITGPAAAAKARRLGPLRRLAPRVPSRSSPLWLAGVAASPTAKTMLVAGAAGLRSRDVAVANVAGTIVRVLAILGFGHAFPNIGVALATVAPWLALPGCLAALAVGVLRLRRGGQPAPVPAPAGGT